MFNVERLYPEPSCLVRKIYNDSEVVIKLKIMFHEKCYLCERDEIQDVEIEHFIPHENNETLKYKWENLNYSCSRCNSIKSNTHTNLLDCTDNSINVGGLICCKMPSSPSDNVYIKATSNTPNIQTVNTVNLLNQCYNLENTTLRGISRESLLEEMWEHYTDLLFARHVLKKKNSAKNDKIIAEQTIEAMLRVEYPFSIFWRYYYLGDNFLLSKYSHLRVEF